MKKSWKQKLNINRVPEVEVVEKGFGAITPGTKMLISTPLETEELVNSIPEGKVMFSPEIRATLAAKHGADTTCPLTTGIFLRIIAEAAWDEHLEGKAIKECTPFWRAIDPKSPLAKKLRCGPEFLREMQGAESNSKA